MALPSPVQLPTDALQSQLGAAGAAERDPLGWHYAQALAARTRLQRGPAQAQLLGKLLAALDALAQRLSQPPAPRPPSAPSAALVALRDERLRLQQAQSAAHSIAWSAPQTRPAESARVGQVRRQLGRMQVHKQVSQALSQAPLNAGPINSQMLVLRALALLRERSPDYLNRLMTEVDTLLCLEDAERQRTAAKASAAPRSRNPVKKSTARD